MVAWSHLYLLISITWIAFILPIRMAFENQSQIDTYVVILDTFSDIYFIIDMFLNVFTPVYDSGGILVYPY